VPEAFGDEAALKEGEGSLSVGEDQLKEKRSQSKSTNYLIAN